MKYPNFREEKKLARYGFKTTVGIDEAGRGPLAGPVVACALAIKTKDKKPGSRKNSPRDKRNIKDTYKKIKNELAEIKDSKKLTPKKREELFLFLTNHPDIKWATGRVSEKAIDKINIFEATKLAMKRAVKNLNFKLQNVDYKIDFIILDGNIKLGLPVWQTSIVKADEKVYSCACASIVAKVIRDRMMLRYHKKYPRYGFDRHKGYGTRQHMAALAKHGPCPIHRRSFRPIRLTNTNNQDTITKP